MRKWGQVLVAVLLIQVNYIAAALVEEMRTNPSSVNVSATVEVTVTGQLPVSGNPRLADVIDQSPRPTLTLRPRNPTLRWDPRCDAAAPFPATSPQGRFLWNGQQVGTTGAVSSSPTCTTSFGNATFNETINIPRSITDMILAEVLKTPVSRIAGNPGYTASFSMQYIRTFTHVGESKQFQVPVVFRVGVQADLNYSRLVSVEASGNTGFVPLRVGVSVTLPLTWRIGIETSGSGQSLTIRSDALEYRTPDGQLLQRVASPLVQAYVPGLAGWQGMEGGHLLTDLTGHLVPAAAAQAHLSTLQVRENLVIPMSVVNRARQLGANQLVVSRVFSDGRNSQVGSITQPLGGTGVLQITRMDLYFSDGGSRVKVFDEGAAVRAVADINYLGSGQLRATWEWAPLTPGGVPLFRPLPPASQLDQGQLGDLKQSVDTRRTLTLVREYLNDLKLVTFYSPPLPTGNPGVYVVRLRIESPAPPFAVPVIRYYIGVSPESGMREAPPPAPLQVTEPAPGKDATPETSFAWQAVDTTRVYRLEVYPDPELSGSMVTGILVPADKLATDLTPLVTNHLRAGSSYWCRIVAINAAGEVHAASEAFQLRVP